MLPRCQRILSCCDLGSVIVPSMEVNILTHVHTGKDSYLLLLAAVMQCYPRRSFEKQLFSMRGSDLDLDHFLLHRSSSQNCSCKLYNQWDPMMNYFCSQTPKQVAGYCLYILKSTSLQSLLLATTNHNRIYRWNSQTRKYHISSIPIQSWKPAGPCIDSSLISLGVGHLSFHTHTNSPLFSSYHPMKLWIRLAIPDFKLTDSTIDLSEKFCCT